jgi:hypothetical protein
MSKVKKEIPILINIIFKKTIKQKVLLKKMEENYTI